MTSIVRIPTPLRSFSKGQDQVTIAGGTVREVLGNLELAYNGIGSRIRDENGELRRFVNVFLNSEDVRHLNGLDTEVKAGDTIAIIPAIAGGK